MHVGALAAVVPLAVALPTAAQVAAPEGAQSSYTSGGEGFQYHPFLLHVDGGGTITQRTNAGLLDNGWNAGLGLTWYPASQLPLGLRLDGSYMRFTARAPLLSQAAALYQTQVDDGIVKMWGGDADVEIDFPFGPRTRFYLVGGVGWYRLETTYRQLQLVNTNFCSSSLGCYPGVPSTTHAVVGTTRTGWQYSRNAGFGMEFSLGGRNSFFIDARYMRLNPSNSRSDFIPIRAGVRF